MKSIDCLCCFHGNVLVYNKYEIKTIKKKKKNKKKNI